MPPFCRSIAGPLPVPNTVVTLERNLTTKALPDCRLNSVVAQHDAAVAAAALGPSFTAAGNVTSRWRQKRSTYNRTRGSHGAPDVDSVVHVRHQSDF